MEFAVSWKILLALLALPMVFPLSVSSTTFVGRRNNSRSLMRDSTKGLAWARFVKNEKRYLDANKTHITNVSRLGQCAMNCVKTFTSFSFNFGIQSNANGNYICEVLSTDRYNDSDKYKISEDFHHYSIYSPCSDEPCQNGATCRPLYETDEYTCACPIGFKGKNCETVICKADWKFFNGSCYKYVDTQITWSNTKTHCERNGSTLVSIHSDEENTFITTFKEFKTRVWIGLNDIDRKGTFRWADGSQVDYVNWRPGQPNRGNELAVVIDRVDKKWDDYPISFQFSYVCKYTP